MCWNWNPGHRPGEESPTERHTIDTHLHALIQKSNARLYASYLCWKGVTYIEGMKEEDILRVSERIYVKPFSQLA